MQTQLKCRFCGGQACHERKTLQMSVEKMLSSLTGSPSNTQKRMNVQAQEGNKRLN